MLRQIDYIAVHHTGTAFNANFKDLRNEYLRQGKIPFHGVIDFSGKFHRLVGMNTTLDVDCMFNERCFHIAYIGNGSINNVHYQLLRRIEVFENAIGQEIKYPTLLYPINPMQQYALRLKIAELRGMFPKVKVRGIDKLSGQKNNPGFGVNTWLKEFEAGVIDEHYINLNFQDVFFEEEQRKIKQNGGKEVWMFDETSDEQAYRQAAENQRVLENLLNYEAGAEDEDFDPEQGI